MNHHPLLKLDSKPLNGRLELIDQALRLTFSACQVGLEALLFFQFPIGQNVDLSCTKTLKQIAIM